MCYIFRTHIDSLDLINVIWELCLIVYLKKKVKQHHVINLIMRVELTGRVPSSLSTFILTHFTYMGLYFDFSECGVEPKMDHILLFILNYLFQKKIKKTTNYKIYFCSEMIRGSTNTSSSTNTNLLWLYVFVFHFPNSCYNYINYEVEEELHFSNAGCVGVFLIKF